MHDMNTTAILAAELDHEPDRVVLPCARPRGEVPRVAAALGLGRRWRADLGSHELGMDQKR